MESLAPNPLSINSHSNALCLFHCSDWSIEERCACRRTQWIRLQMIVWLIICSVISVVFHAPLSFPIPVIPDHNCRRIRTRCLLHRRALRAARKHPQRGHIVPAPRLLLFTESGQRGVLPFWCCQETCLSLLSYTARFSHPCGSQQQRQPRVSLCSAPPDSTA